MKTRELILGEHPMSFRKIFLLLAGFGVALSSCNNNETVSDFSAEDSENVQAVSNEDMSSDDADDVTTAALESQDPSSGGRVGDADDRLDCATVTRTGSDGAGTVRIDFGDGCTDLRGNVRKGVMVIDFEGRWFRPGSFWRLRFENYSINGIVLGGIRTVTNVTTDTTRLAFTVELEDGSATWPDGSIARRRVHHKRELERNANHILERLIIYGTAEGNHRNGRGYYIEILEPLVYSRRCAAEGVIIPVQGKKLIKHGDRQITVDYGDGKCDNVVTLINKNGRTKEYTVGG